MAEETVSKEVEMKDVEGGEEKSEKEEASGSQQQKDKNLLIFEGKETELKNRLYCLTSQSLSLRFWPVTVAFGHMMWLSSLVRQASCQEPGIWRHPK